MVEDTTRSRWKNEAWREGFRIGSEMIQGWWGLYQSEPEVACLRSRRWMGIRRSPLLQKASKIEAGAIAADIYSLFLPLLLRLFFFVTRRWTKNRRNNYRTSDERGVQYAILFGATVLIIASEAITSRRGKIPLPDHGRTRKGSRDTRGRRCVSTCSHHRPIFTNSVFRVWITRDCWNFRNFLRQMGCHRWSISARKVSSFQLCSLISFFFFRTNNLRYRIQCKNRISVSLISSLVCIDKCLESVTSDTPKAFTFHQLVLDRLYLWHLLQLQLISIYSLIARTRFQHLATFPFARYPLTYVASYSVPSPYRYRS